MNTELTPKRLELLSELVPQAGVIALLVNPNSLSAERIIRDVEEAARVKGVRLHILKASAEGDFETAFATIVKMRAGALVVGNDSFFNSRREDLVALAARYAVPAIYEWREFAEAGGLISYGASLTGIWHLAGTYVGKILKGAKPADLPVQQPTTFELVVNLQTAKALGLTVPPSILHPSTLLKIYLYGYLNRLQSGRRLEREAQRNIELMWLARRLAPDFKTIADFRKDNGAAIRAVCRQFVESQAASASAWP
jgi:ABC-type uncharacterized transport system substrate-binding protein